MVHTVFSGDAKPFARTHIQTNVVLKIMMVHRGFGRSCGMISGSAEKTSIPNSLAHQAMTLVLL